MEKFYIVVFGATGFTGKSTLPYLHKLAQNPERSLTWGIGGRSLEKLQNILHEASTRIGADLSGIPIIIADSTNEKSIMEMTKKARMIINCCGPYQVHGEVVVRSCIETGTHYVDVTAEPYFQEAMEKKYHEAAQRQGIYIVNYCGYGYMATEIPVCLLENKFPGTLNSVEIFTDTYQGVYSQGSQFNIGSWKSAVVASSKLKTFFWNKIKRDWNSVKMRPKICSRLPFSRITSIGIPNKKILPFPSPDIDIINRSQRYFYENVEKRPIQVRHYYLLDSWKSILKLLFMGMITIIFSQFSCGRKLLLKYPKVFSGGHFDHESPNEEVVENTKICMYFYGKGWSNKKDSQFNQPPNKSILGKIDIVNPAYGFTCLAVVLSAIIILTEPSKLPKKGGVYTPAAAFFDTSMVEALQKNGVPLNILSENDL
ncbi:hypothetical protein PPYR_12103 [Photinus pyralis]|uniref:Saccharopine dehydrogenase NADP binding domain-containing protein n=1 Tax=Photinus pyralis TaxID=7054 RepID=A0A5N4AD69_PHOPY|nr:hypothetical protein PPYR_12103 [Photinus pyralis]